MPMRDPDKIEQMERSSTLLLTHVDHLTGEEIGWAISALDIPGVRSRNLIPTLAKKGRPGHILLVEVEPQAEEEVGRLLMECFNIHGYNRIETTHVYQNTVIKEVKIRVHDGSGLVEGRVRLKRKAGDVRGPHFVESDDLFALHERICKELEKNISLLALRRHIESSAGSLHNEEICIDLALNRLESV